MLVANYYLQSLYTQQGPGPYGEFYFYVGDVQGVGIQWDGWLARFWQLGRINTAGDVVRPTIPMGYEAACTQGGQSAAAEPIWTTSGIVQDGTTQWTMQTISNASLTSTVSSAVWSESSGLIVITNPSIVGQFTSAFMDTTACIQGTDYVAKCVTTMQDGTLKAGEFKLKVR